jgi:hypothetical protein
VKSLLRPETARAACGRRPYKLLRENLLAASLHEIRLFSTAGAPDENCRGELKHPALFAFASGHTI